MTNFAPPNLVPIGRALLSVSDKTGLLDLARALAAQGVELISTGGTSGMLRTAGLKVRDVSEVTGFPEMMDGRVKTLHPNVHGALLALRDDDEHLLAMAAHGIEPIDLVVVNLYPFEETVAKGGDYETCIENIDIGGPAMIRAASKNHRFVTVMTDPADYAGLIDQLRAHDGATTLAYRQKLALAAYARTAAYDTAVSAWLSGQLGQPFTRSKSFAGTLAQGLRYGENPHQAAAFYTDGSRREGVATAKQWQGKELSYNNINDTDAAFELVAEFAGAGPACAIIKHANPCGVGKVATLKEAYLRAYACDQTSAFGGIVALNRPVDAATAQQLTAIFLEAVIAPAFDAEALEILTAKKNVRLLEAALPQADAKQRYDIKTVSGGMLIQSTDTADAPQTEWKTVSKRLPTQAELKELELAWKVVKHVKSNAIVIARDGRTIGVGAGQMNRVGSAEIALKQAGEAARGAVMSSDAFFPFRDTVDAAAKAGITAIIQPGGSMRDEESIAAADEHGIAMIFTGMRHFKH